GAMNPTARPPVRQPSRSSSQRSQPATRQPLSGHKASGATFIDNTPDEVWKYVPIHELGHYFGLCHVDGLDRIMFSTRQNTWWRGWLLPRLAWSAFLRGEPSFVLDEAKAAWDYIVANFNAECLGARSQRPPIG
ncbi:hypothetical protein ABT124_39835, partial [Streptomyces sp. NPDC001982]|uniref:hypothetical protein n=1 Tax=Streptomyces sp. NPDC001982 TaxID=3154405 RepID=UPI00333070BE